MTENEVIKIFENEVIILDCWIEHCKDIIADCETEDDEFDDDKERAELSLKDYTERKEAFDVAISALKEIQQYRKIGTVEECKKAREKQNPKKPIPINYQKYANKIENADFLEDSYLCPNCKTVIRSGSYCNRCGQKICWGENLEGMEDEEN